VSDQAELTLASSWVAETAEKSYAARRASSTHMPGLDGLRGIAVLGVIIYHLPDGATSSLFGKLIAHAARLGWVGVDLFFVLSGYLITGILIDARGRPHYFRTFFGRRALRIVPVYVAFLLFSLWVSSPLGTSTIDAAARLHHLQWWYWTYLLNVYIALHGFTSIASGTLHLWTLAVEEQFYLLWPVAVLLLTSRALPRVALACLVVAELCRIVVVVLGWEGQVNYVLLPTRMDTLAAGAFLACAERDLGLAEKVRRWRFQIVLVSGAALLLPLLRDYTLDGQLWLTQLVGLPALALLSAMAVLHASRSEGWLASPPLRFVGKYSYGMYIWHGVIIAAIARYTDLLYPREPFNVALFYYLMSIAAAVAASMAIAFLSWYLIERPFVRLKRFLQYA
jgi:peptidoglycan/LPS O-acetylase OafA/YrhL